MYAIIRTGGKQYRVEEGSTVTVERDVLGGVDRDKITFSDVLMIGGDQPQIGAPTLSGASVVATVVRERRGDKIIVFKFKRKKQYKKTIGHRQSFTEVKVGDIVV